MVKLAALFPKLGEKTYSLFGMLVYPVRFFIVKLFSVAVRVEFKLNALFLPD